MGNNFSKPHWVVEQHVLSRAFELTRMNLVNPEAKTVEIPVDQLKTVTTTSDSIMRADLHSTQKQGWKACCYKHSISGKQEIRSARALAQIVGQATMSDLMQTAGTMWKTADERAVFIMWVLEDEIDHPWRVLRKLILDLLVATWEEFLILLSVRLQAAKSSFRPQLCWNCNKVPTRIDHLLSCAGCHVAKYCHRNCQELHWLQHSQECDLLRSVSTQDSAVRSGSSSKS